MGGTWKRFGRNLFVPMGYVKNIAWQHEQELRTAQRQLTGTSDDFDSFATSTIQRVRKTICKINNAIPRIMQWNDFINLQVLRKHLSLPSIVESLVERFLDVT